MSFDFTETFNLIIKQVTMRIFITIALSRHWKMYQLNINTEFLNGDLPGVYMAQPSGFEDTQYPHFVCKLKKAIFGLRQAPRA